MIDLSQAAPLMEAVQKFIEHLASQVKVRWTRWPYDHKERDVREVIGGLLARQASLVRVMAVNPFFWNSHTAPLLLRPMVENCITLAWILKDPLERAQQFITYGLGQENLLLEQAKADLRDRGLDPDEDPDIEQWEMWINSHRYTFLTEVNVGNWGPNLRTMAEEAGLIDLHRNDYTTLSGATHGMWQHVVRYYLEGCTNPLHGFHRIPSIPNFDPHLEFLRHAALYMDLAIEIFDESIGLDVEDDTAIQILSNEVEDAWNLWQDSTGT